MKEQFKTIILPTLPIIGCLKLISTLDDYFISIQFSKDEAPTKETDFSIQCYRELHSYLNGFTQELNLPFKLNQLNPFHDKILQEIKRIPYGETRTYKELGLSVQSKAYQAIGSACRRNPLPIMIPCHRVTGIKNPYFYLGGEEMKKKLLQLENPSLIKPSRFSYQQNMGAQRDICR
jgi:methylated-DNA-[protein]-cysteine S-methyltransferase